MNKTSKKAKKGSSTIPEDLVERGREIWLAGLGALATVEQEGAKFFNSLVERGRSMEDKGRKQIEGVVDDLQDRQQKVGDTVDQTFAKMETSVSGTVEKIMHRLDVPTRSEVQDLTKKVNQLAGKVDQLATILEAEKKAATEKG